MEIRVHWLNYDKSNVWYRSVHKIPFIYCTSNTTWRVYKESSIIFGEQICSQLARQNIIKNRHLEEVDIIYPNLQYNIIPDPVYLSKTIEVIPKIVSSGYIRGNATGDSFDKNMHRSETTGSWSLPEVSWAPPLSITVVR